MELIFLSLEKKSFKWTTRIPSLHCSFNSPSVLLDEFSWFFKFEAFQNYRNGEMWLFYLQTWRKKPVNLNKYLLAILARNREGVFENIGCSVIGGDYPCDDMICGITRSSFASDHPNIDISDGTLTLMFVFDQGIRNLADHQENVNKEHRFIKTSSCLENLSRDLHKLMGEDSNPDVQLRCGNYIFPAHRLILSARSEVFRDMLQSNLLEGQEGPIEIVNMEPSIFELFLRYLYTGTLPELSVSTASPLYETGDKYHLEVLKRRCGDFLLENLTPDSACEILVMADAHGDKDLKERVVSYVLNQEIPDKEDGWSKFSDNHPRLSNEVLYRAYRRLKSSK